MAEQWVALTVVWRVAKTVVATVDSTDCLRVARMVDSTAVWTAGHSAAHWVGKRGADLAALTEAMLAAQWVVEMVGSWVYKWVASRVATMASNWAGRMVSRRAVRSAETKVERKVSQWVASMECSTVVWLAHRWADLMENRWVAKRGK